MKKENMKYIVIAAITTVLAIALGLYNNANQAVDAIVINVDITNGIGQLHVLLLTIVIETIVFQYFWKEDYVKTYALVSLANVISTALSVIVLFVVGLLVEVIMLPFALPSFHVIMWIVNILIVIVVMSAMEGLVAKLTFKLKFKQIYKWLLIANAASFAVAFVLNLGNWLPYIYF